MGNRGPASRRAQRVEAQQRRRRVRVALVAALVVVLTGAVLTLVFGGQGDEVDDGTFRIDVDMFEYGFSGELTAPSGPLRIDATNTGEIPHNIGIRRGPITNEIRPGGSVSLEIEGIAPGTYELYCDIVGHVEKGMVAPLVITEPLPTSTTVAP